MDFFNFRIAVTAPDSEDDSKSSFDPRDLLLALTAPKSKDNPKRSFDLGDGHFLDVHYLEKEEKGYPASILYQNENKRNIVVGTFISTGRATDRYLVQAIHYGWTLRAEPIFLLPEHNETVIEVGRELGDYMKPKLDLVHNADRPAE